jgi:hypothetical protein
VPEKLPYACLSNALNAKFAALLDENRQLAKRWRELRCQLEQRGKKNELPFFFIRAALKPQHADILRELQRLERIADEQTEPQFEAARSVYHSWASQNVRLTHQIEKLTEALAAEGV